MTEQIPQSEALRASDAESAAVQKTPNRVTLDHINSQIAAIEYQPHEQRVFDEKAELDGRLMKLRSFLGSVIFSSLPELERLRLFRQAEVMAEYSRILAERIAAFPVER